MDKRHNISDMLLNELELTLVNKELNRRYGMIEILSFDYKELKDTILKAKVNHNGMFLYIDINLVFFINTNRKKLIKNPFGKFKRVFDIIESELIFFDEYVNNFNMEDEYFLPFIDYDFILSEILWTKGLNSYIDCEIVERELELYLDNLFKCRKFKSYKELHSFAIRDFTKARRA